VSPSATEIAGPSAPATAEQRRSEAVRSFVFAMVAAGAIAVGASIALAPGVPTVWALAVTAAALALGDLPVVHLRHGDQNHSFTWSEAALVAGLVLLPAWWVPLVGAAVVTLAQTLLRRAPLKVAFNAASFALAAFAATAAFLAVAGAVPTSADWLALAVATATYFVVNWAAVTVVVARSQGLPLLEVGRSGVLLGALFALANSSVAILIAIAAPTEPLLLIALAPVLAQLLLVHRNTREVIRERDLWMSVQVASQELQRTRPEALPDTALDAVERLVGASVVEVTLLGDGGAARQRRVGGVLERAHGSIAEVAGDVWGRAECDRAPFWLEAPTASERQRGWLEDAGCRSAIVVPLEWAGSVVGLLRVGFRSQPDSMQRTESVLRTIGTQIASAVTSNLQTATLRHQAEHDELTGLPNRKTLVRHLDERLREGPGSASGLAVLFFDLDEFKVVNDSLGHHIGDQLLLDAAQRLRSEMRPQDLVARFGGDEFIVLCDGLAEPGVAVEIAQRLLDALAGHTEGDRNRPISASVGIAHAAGYTDADDLLRDADAAMYRAKRNGPGSACLFTTELRTQALDRLHLEADLRVALRNHDLEVHYQPIVDVQTGAIHELEALARWHHPVRGPVSPAAFISVAEESGHIRALGEFVLNQACADMRRWLDLGLATRGQRVAVNLSRLQLDRTLPTVIGEALARHGLPASALTLEVTESAFVDDPDGVASLERLRDMGVRVALDDFGTGYSSLSTLRDLPADTVKVDRSFVARLGEDSQLTALVRGIVDLAHALDLVVVAEGVESEAQAEMLADVGCDLAQGWLHGRPVAAAVIEAVLATAVERRSSPARAAGRNLRLA
jgi:diguanylate cyclase (GGDEF)-like protein